MDLVDLLFRVGLYAGIGSVLVLAFLVPLQVQQSRDIRRLREWARLTPDSDTAEFQAAQSAGLATAVGAPAPAGMARPGRRDTVPMPAVSAAQRVARELPAAARATAERPALGPGPWWRRFLRRPDPRYLAAIVAGVLVLGVGVGVLAVRTSHEEPPVPPGQAEGPVVDPSQVEVAVLNGTAVPGLAAKVGDDLTAAGFQLGALTNSPPRPDSVVMYQRGHELEARAAAKRLGIERVEVIDPEIERIVAEASEPTGTEPAAVVVIAGEDRARP